MIYDKEDLTPDYLMGLAEGRKQGLRLAEDACTALERRKWELMQKTLSTGGTLATVAGGETKTVVFQATIN